MARFPLIGVTTSITVGSSPGRAYVNSTYLRAIQEAGGVPIAGNFQMPRLGQRDPQQFRARVGTGRPADAPAAADDDATG